MNDIGWPKLHRDRVGVRVRSKIPLGNFVGQVPAGTLGAVEGGGRGWNDLSIRFDVCKHCGIQLRVSGVSRRALEVVEGVSF